MAWFTCVSYYYFLYVVIYAPRLKDFVLSLGGFLVVVVVVVDIFLRKKSHFEETVHIETYGC